eukprot:CAMPEP_0172579000 /NCGR_PEP_ID=MMETSP1067-20121228/139021_1 /TAXON_ID=265564 ORGANISM="Thalassiosira punctigera, Strain Tpunct2005C2" /NCGR_SAMPLE_ID=MMETSP1067 /ASSEMBLY_ACC=CAM_ASM_000444 /LENGTH=637 /DNA_ID=CAMNT_0013371707 /DNA_START=98 /DNA_END=2009 /DNA_ORIENTATION=+
MASAAATAAAQGDEDAAASSAAIASAIDPPADGNEVVVPDPVQLFAPDYEGSHGRVATIVPSPVRASKAQRTVAGRSTTAHAKKPVTASSPRRKKRGSIAPPSPSRGRMTRAAALVANAIAASDLAAPPSVSRSTRSPPDLLTNVFEEQPPPPKPAPKRTKKTKKAKSGNVMIGLVPKSGFFVKQRELLNSSDDLRPGLSRRATPSNIVVKVILDRIPSGQEIRSGRRPGFGRKALLFDQTAQPPPEESSLSGHPTCLLYQPFALAPFSALVAPSPPASSISFAFHFASFLAFLAALFAFFSFFLSRFDLSDFGGAAVVAQVASTTAAVTVFLRHGRVATIVPSPVRASKAQRTVAGRSTTAHAKKPVTASSPRRKKRGSIAPPSPSRGRMTRAAALVANAIAASDPTGVPIRTPYARAERIAHEEADVRSDEGAHPGAFRGAHAGTDERSDRAADARADERSDEEAVEGSHREAHSRAVEGADDDPTGRPTPEPTSDPTRRPTDRPTLGPTTDAPTPYEPFFFGDEFVTYDNLGIEVSKGLSVRVVAREGRPVPYADGGESKLDYHEWTDAAGIIPTNPDNPTEGGYVYVANSEDSNGGVYGIYFDGDGNVLEYKALLRGTTDNCGGGHTPWNTWV